MSAKWSINRDLCFFLELQIIFPNKFALVQSSFYTDHLPDRSSSTALMDVISRKREIEARLREIESTERRLLTSSNTSDHHGSSARFFGSHEDLDHTFPESSGQRWFNSGFFLTFTDSCLIWVKSVGNLVNVCEMHKSYWKFRKVDVSWKL